jgi:hypothetical protein
MPRLLSQITSPTALFYIFLVITQVIAGIYSSSDLELPRSYEALYTLGFPWIIGLWLQKDSRKNGVVWVFDMGWFVYIAWPFIMPYHFFKTRGAKAFLPILAFIGIYSGADLIGRAIYALLAS